MKQNKLETYEITADVCVGIPFFGYDYITPRCFKYLSWSIDSIVD